MLLSTMTNIHQTFRHTCGEYAYPLEEALEYIARAGFPAADLSLISVCAHGNILETDRWMEFVDNCREALTRTKIIPCQAHAYYAQTRDGVYGTAAFERDQMLTDRTIRVAAMLWVPWVTVHPLYGTCLAGHDENEILEINRVHFCRWGETAVRMGVGIAIENMISPPFNDPDNLLRLLTTLGDDQLFGVCLDTGHAHLNAIDLPSLILRLGKRLRTTHIHDNHGRYDEHLPPYLGDIEWEPVMRAMRQSGYDGAFSFEVPQTTRNIPAALHDDVIRYAHTLGEYLLHIE